MKSVCTPVLRYSLASSPSLSLAAVRPGAVMSTGSPRTQTACEPRLTERQSGCAAAVSSALSAYASRSPDQLLPPSPAEGTPLPHVEAPIIIIIFSFYQNVEILSPHLFIGFRRKLQRDRGAKLAVQRRARRDVDASRGNKEVKSAYPPPPQPKNENAGGEKHSVASRTHQWGTRGCPAAGESERTAGELLITRAIHRLSCSVSNQGGSWGFRGIKYGLRVNRRRRGLVALTGKKCMGQLRADGEGGCMRRFSRGAG